MEFTYKLSEAEYIRASGLGIKRPRGPWRRLLSSLYPTAFFLAVWGSLLSGMVLERNDLVGITANDLQGRQTFRSRSPAPLLSASFVPALGIFCLLVISLRLLFRLPNRRARREQFQRNPGCQVETTVTATPASITFRSATGSSESSWKCYSAWDEKDGVLALVTHAGVRQILSTASLPEGAKAELRRILTAEISNK